ncbi:MAG: rod shape-determining protein MreC [Syntrophobacterales bacterium]|nr:rod shape-determining protein MreC [Syntrophobacterales bacterium]
MWNLLRRVRGFLFVLFILLLTFYIFSLNYKRHTMDSIQQALLNLTVPIFSAWTEIFHSFQELVSKYLWLVRVEEENRALRKEIARLENELISYREAYFENQRLRRLLEFRNSIEWKSISALVVVNDLSGFFQAVIVNRGKQDGVFENIPVINDEGVVGRTINAGRNFSRVMLITDPASAVDVYIQRNRTRGIVVGKDFQHCALKYIRNDADVRPGDLLVTSGKDGVFPEGIKVGIVKANYKDPLKMFQQVEVTPLVRLNHIEEVLILIPSTTIDRDIGNSR